MTLKDIVPVTIKDGGCTYSLVEGDMKGTRNYVVALKGNEMVVPKESFNVFCIKQYVRDNIEWLCELYGVFAIGTWVHEDQIYLDVVRLYDKDKYALGFIKDTIVKQNQISGWDLELDQEIKP